MAKIGIIGGTFDPIHNAHIAMAESAKKKLGLSEVIFIPGGNPPHKTDKRITDKYLRLKMVNAAMDKPYFSVSKYEVEKQGYSYTADTLRHITAKQEQNEYFFIMGADSLDYIESWHKPEVILSLAEIVVFSRADYDVKAVAAAVQKRLGGKITVINDKIPDISSTKIRMYVDMGFDISEYVPSRVQSLIKEYGLYCEELSAMRERIGSVLQNKRFLHTMGVCKLATELARRFGEDEKKTYIAALLHDSAKNIPEGKMYKMCSEYGVYLNDTEMKNSQLVHAKLGAYLAQKLYGIDDADIINAVRWHTLGRCNMSRLEKIIFVSDMAEEGRRFDGVDEIRAAARKNLDEAVYMCADQTIRFNEKKGVEVHENAYAVRDYFKKNAQ